MRFRKKPVVIEAVQISHTNGKQLTAFCGSCDVFGDQHGRVVSVHIGTLEGTMIGQVGDWIIKGVKGEFYPCKDEIFRETYEPAEN